MDHSRCHIPEETRGVVSGDKLVARSAIAGAYRVMNRVVLD